MRRSNPVLQAIGLSIGLLSVVVLVAVGLQTLLVGAPTLRDGTFMDGLLHGTTAPVGAWRWAWGTGAVKDFASGWGYELGFHVGALSLVVAWQTILQARAYAMAGSTHRLVRPFLLGTVALWLGLVVLGLALGSPSIPIGDVPPLYGVVPGWLRHGAMAVFALLVATTGGLAGGDLLRRGM